MGCGLKMNGCVLSYFEGTANVHCYTSCESETHFCDIVYIVFFLFTDT